MTADRQRLIEQTVTTLHFLVRQTMTREEAIELKQKMLMPIGLLNGSHNLVSESQMKNITRNRYGGIDYTMDTPPALKKMFDVKG